MFRLLAQLFVVYLILQYVIKIDIDSHIEKWSQPLVESFYEQLDQLPMLADSDMLAGLKDMLNQHDFDLSKLQDLLENNEFDQQQIQSLLEGGNLSELLNTDNLSQEQIDQQVKDLQQQLQQKLAELKKQTQNI